MKSGFRISELLSLKVKDVLQQGAIVDRVSIERRYMKGGERGRVVALHSDAKLALLELIKVDDLKPDHYLFKSRSGYNAPIDRTQAWRILKAAYRAAGICGKLATHSMRKTFAVGIHERLGRDLMRTQRALGHANIANTIKYLTADQEEIDAAVLSL